MCKHECEQPTVSLGERTLQKAADAVLEDVVGDLGIDCAQRVVEEVDIRVLVAPAVAPGEVQ